MLCSTTDPYQTISVPGNPAKQKVLQQHTRFLVRRALELIREHSTLNVRILTRSPLAREDFDLDQRFGNRLLFGMSLPTLQDRWTSIYEPGAPGPRKRLETLRKARDAGLNVFVAVAPTYPECDEADLRATLQAIRPLKPVTIFHEPINIRAANVPRIATHAAGLQPPVRLRTEVFATPMSWRCYAVEQLVTMQRVATELGLEEQLHLWPDKNLRTKAGFLQVRRERFAQAKPGYRATALETVRRRADDERAYQEFEQWLSHWHSRISAWPGGHLS